jgi:hypothetical protein
MSMRGALLLVVGPEISSRLESFSARPFVCSISIPLPGKLLSSVKWPLGHREGSDSESSTGVPHNRATRPGRQTPTAVKQDTALNRSRSNTASRAHRSTALIHTMHPLRVRMLQVQSARQGSSSLLSRPEISAWAGSQPGPADPRPLSIYSLRHAVRSPVTRTVGRYMTQRHLVQRPLTVAARWRC